MGLKSSFLQEIVSEEFEKFLEFSLYLRMKYDDMSFILHQQKTILKASPPQTLKLR